MSPGERLLSVVVITRDAWRALEQVLDVLTAQVTERGLELILVDDGSDAPLDLRRLNALRGVHTIRLSEAQGRAAARNRGAAAATGERLLFLDGDMVPGDGLLAAHARYAADSTVVMGYRYDLYEPSAAGIGTGRYEPDRRERFFERYGEDVSRWIMPWQIGYTHNLSVARLDFERVGGFDESFRSWGCEDDEFAYRLHHAGVKFVFARDAVAFHLPHERSQPQEKASNMRNSAAIIAKHRTADVELLHHLRQTRYVETQTVVRKLVDAASRVAASAQAVEQTADRLEAPCLALGAGPESRSTSRTVMSHASLVRAAERESFFGVALPFAEAQFATTLLGDFCFALPEFTCDVVREAKRVSRRVFARPSTLSRSSRHALAAEGIDVRTVDGPSLVELSSG